MRKEASILEFAENSLPKRLVLSLGEVGSIAIRIQMDRSRERRWTEIMIFLLPGTKENFQRWRQIAHHTNSFIESGVWLDEE